MPGAMRVNYWALGLSLLFAAFALLQFNDVDPWSWVLLYALVAAILGFRAVGYIRPWAVYGGLAVVAVWLMVLLPEFVQWVRMGMPGIAEEMKATEPHIEYAREFLGLVLSGLALVWVLWKRP